MVDKHRYMVIDTTPLGGTRARARTYVTLLKAYWSRVEECYRHVSDCRARDRRSHVCSYKMIDPQPSLSSLTNTQTSSQGNLRPKQGTKTYKIWPQEKHVCQGHKSEHAQYDINDSKDWKHRLTINILTWYTACHKNTIQINLTSSN